MRIPTVHLNGTGKEELAEQVLHAGSMLRLAITAMESAAPNGRDYYPQGPDAIREAQEEHRDRVRRVQAVRDELCAMWEGITSQEGRPQ